MYNVGKIGIELGTNTKSFTNAITSAMSHAQGVVSQTAKAIHSATASAFSSKEVTSYAKQIDYLQYKLDDLKATIQIGNEHKGFFGTTEMKEMEAEAEQLQNQLIRMKETSEQTGDSFSKLGSQIKSAFNGERANEITSKLSSMGQAGMNALQQLSSSGDGLGSKIATKVLPAVEKLAPAFSKAIPYVGQVVAVAQGLVAVGKSVKNAFEKVTSTVKNMASKIKSALSKVASGFKNVINKAKEFIGLSSKADSSWSSALKSIGGLLVATFGLRKLYEFGKESVNVASESQSAWTGLNSIVTGTGGSFDKSRKFLEEYTKDGLIPLTNAVTAYKNLSARGYNTEQIEQTLTSLKDASAFGRQASYSYGDAITSATEGLKNENSVLVDNAGVTKNVAKMWDEYAKSIGTTANNLTQQQKIQAEVNGITQETKFQVGDASRYADTYAGKLARLSTAFYNLKLAVGQVVTPIIELLLPVIERATNAITKMFNKLKSVMAMFGLEMKEYIGKDTTSSISNAVDSTGDLSNGLDGAGTTAEKTAKKIQKAFAKVDELNVLNFNKSDGSTGGNSGGGSGGSGGSSGGIGDDSIGGEITQNQSVIDKIKKSAFDWGVAFGEAINSALEKIPWDLIQATVINVATKIAEFLNGAVAGLDWGLVGNTLGEGINTILYGLNTFYKVFDWDALGVGLGEGINGMIESVDWETLGEFLARKFSSTFQILSNMLGTIDWKQFGHSLGSGLQSFIDYVDFDAIADTFTNGFNGVFTLIGNFFIAVDWGSLGKKLVDGINRAFTNLNFDTVGEALKNGLNSAIDFAWNAVINFDAKKAGEKIASLLNNIAKAIKNTDWRKLGETFSGGFHKSFELARNLIRETDWGELVKSVIDGIVDFLVGFDWGQLALDILGLLWDVGVAIVEGIWQGIKSAIVGVARILYDILVQPIVDGVKKLFGINSPSTVFAEIGDFLIQGLWSGISGAKDWIVKKWGEVKGWFTDIVKTASIKITQKWKDIKKGWTDLTSNIKNKTAEMKAKVATKWKDITKSWHNIIDNVKNKTAEMKAKVATRWKDIKEKWTNITKNIKNKTADMKARIATKWSDLKSTWNNLLSNIKGKTVEIKAKIGAVSGSVKSLANEVISKVNSTLPSWIPKIPKLATGGWLEANNPQLAIVGDNKREGEIIAPESKIKEQVMKGLEEAGTTKENQQIDLTIKLMYPDGKFLIREINNAQIRDGRVSLLV